MTIKSALPFGHIFGKGFLRRCLSIRVKKQKQLQVKNMRLYVSNAQNGVESGALLVEAVVGMTIILFAMGSFLTLMAQSFSWAQHLQIRNELMYENMTGRQVLRYALLNTEAPITVNYNSRYLIWDGKRRYGIEYGELRRLLENGQKQALSSPTISPNWGSLEVTSVASRSHFTQLTYESRKDGIGPIQMEWQMLLKPSAPLTIPIPPETTRMTIYPMHTYFMRPFDFITEGIGDT